MRLLKFYSLNFNRSYIPNIIHRESLVSLATGYGPGDQGIVFFNVFHVRALYYTKNVNYQQMHKELFHQL
jgi:predicted AlkP superfamily phosphohydrolase/phosphomutase